MKRQIALAVALILLASCRMHWVPVEADPGDFARDQYICNREAREGYAVGEIGGMQTNIRMYVMCMEARGWRKQ